MEKLWGLDLQALLAMVAILLGLSIAAQVLQEIYKFLTASKSRAYKLTLRDFLGSLQSSGDDEESWADKLYDRSGSAAAAESLFLRGPLQFGWKANWKGDKKKARLLPLDKQTLLNALDDTAPDWKRKAITALKKEAELQKGRPAAPSPIVRGLIDEAWKEYQAEDDGPWKVFDFLGRWGAVKTPLPEKAAFERALAAAAEADRAAVLADEAEGKAKQAAVIAEAKEDEAVKAAGGPGAGEAEASEAKAAIEAKAEAEAAAATAKAEAQDAASRAEAAEAALASHQPVCATEIDAAHLLKGYYHEFLPDRAKVEDRFEQLNANFQHSYSRRNLRQTFLLAMLLAVGLNLPFSTIYQQAKSLTPEEATALANSLAQLYDKHSGTDGGAATGAERVGPDSGRTGEETPATPTGEESGDETPPVEPVDQPGGGDGGGDGREGGTSVGGGVGSNDEDDDTSKRDDEEFEELIAELREPLEALLELDKKREEKELAKLIKAIEGTLGQFAALQPVSKQRQQAYAEDQPWLCEPYKPFGRFADLKRSDNGQLADLCGPLASFVEATSDEEAPDQDLEEYFADIVVALREPVGKFVEAREADGKPESEGLVNDVRQALAELLDERADRGKLLTRGVDQIATLWYTDRGRIPTFLANCLITALLISFGAPFWHRLSQALLGAKKATGTWSGNAEVE